ncbi:MAG TPA: Mut7-C RNAse domain-containing protein, partial [Gammaproteobacteria bacterium]|nr:Mut7-C RNAse domain-containing protein [Gammaproteobacteria bacterium]
VYPMFEALDISPLIRLREKPLREPRFIIDANLGRLARYLRLLGFDTLYRNNYRDQEIAHTAQHDRRIVLTRDRALLQHKLITHGYFVRSDKPREQVKEILARLDLYDQARPFTRCMRCNGEMEDVEKHAVDHQLQPRTRQYYHRFRRCTACGQAYWKGSHFEKMERLCEEFLIKRINDQG